MNIEGIRKNYPASNLYSKKNENTNNTSLPKESNNTYFRGHFDKYSDKNVILNPVITPKSFKKFIEEQKEVDCDGNFISRFDSDEIIKLTNLVNSNPSKIKFITKLINEKAVSCRGNVVSRFSADDIDELVHLCSNKNNRNLLNSLLKIQFSKNNILWGPQIAKILKINNKQPDLIHKIISNPKYNIFLQGITDDITDIVNDNNTLDIITSRLTPNYDKFYLNKSYDINHYQLEFTNNKNKEKQIFYMNKTDNGFEYNGYEIQKTKGDKTFVRREFKDGSYLVEEIGNVKFDDDLIPISLKKTQYNDKGVQVRSEVLTPSKDKPGTYTINVYERGLNQSMVKKPVGTVELYGSTNQGMKTKRTVTSSDGTVTSHTIIQGPKGSGMKYEIKDKDGNILGVTERQYRKIDENHYTSSLNGQKYDTQFIDDKIIVSKVDNNINKTQTIELGSDILDPKLKDLYKQLPGDFFFKIKETGLNNIDLEPSIHNNAYYNIYTNTIDVPQESIKNPFIFVHELGHALDWNYKNDELKHNSELKKIYKDELASFKKVSSDAEACSIEYLTTGEYPLSETIAEFSAITSGLINTDISTQLRNIVLQQHFPRTCAKIMDLMNK